MTTSKELPDLVRSSLPNSSNLCKSDVTGLISDTAKTTRIDIQSKSDRFPIYSTPSTQLQAASTATTTFTPDMISFPVDHCGAIDLTAATARHIFMTLMAQQQRISGVENASQLCWKAAATTPLSSFSWSENEALDLSCKTASDSPAVVTTCASTASLLTPSTADKRREKDQRRRHASDKKLPKSGGDRLGTTSSTAASRHAKSQTSGSMTSSSVSSADSSRTTVDFDNPLRWGVRDVIEFVSEVPGCQIYAEVRFVVLMICVDPFV